MLSVARCDATKWGLSFIVPSALIAGLGILTFLLMVSDPRAVGCPSPDHCSADDPKKSQPALELSEKGAVPLDTDHLPHLSLPEKPEEAISFMTALTIPVSFKPVSGNFVAKHYQAVLPYDDSFQSTILFQKFWPSSYFLYLLVKFLQVLNSLLLVHVIYIDFEKKNVPNWLLCIEKEGPFINRWRVFEACWFNADVTIEYLQGVVEYSMCLFFTKFINYTFLYWLPRFIQESSMLVYQNWSHVWFWFVPTLDVMKDLIWVRNLRLICQHCSISAVSLEVF